MTLSPASSPLSQRVQRILLERRGEPINLLELQTVLRRQGQPVSIDRLRAVLSDPQIFTSLANDRYVLRDSFTEPAVLSEQTQPETRVFLRYLPQARHDYIVLDIETSGLNLEHDQIFQIAALRVIDGTPSVFQAWYAYCPAERLSPTIRRRLHLTDEMASQIVAAPPLDALWPDVRGFISALPLVIHNARFDIGFLHQYDPSLANPILDTLELALLVEPRTSQHQQPGICRRDRGC